MVVRKSFRSATTKEPVEFETSEGDEFTARPKMAAGPLLQFAEITTRQDDEGNSNLSMTEMVEAIKGFFRHALPGEEWFRFEAMLDDEEKGINVQELMEIAGWLAGIYTGRPTGEGSPSTSSTKADGTGSTDGASPEASTFSRPEEFAPVVSVPSP